MNLGAPRQYIPTPICEEEKRIQSDIYLQYYQSLVLKGEIPECCGDWRTMVATDAQQLCPHNNAEMPIGCDTFLTAEITLGARFCSISTIIFLSIPPQ